jgi:alpha-amylase
MKTHFLGLLILLSGLTRAQVGIMGSFNNWTSPVFMQTTDQVNWTLNFTFNTNHFMKFREGDNWLINWGGTAFPSGVGVQDGPNIPVPAGNYDIYFNSQTGEYFFDLQDSITPVYTNPKNRQVILQGFWWDFNNNNYPNGWANYLAELAPRLREIGIDAVWIPPTIKNTGTNSVGYAPFDHYDLGDKWQKSNVKTRLGDKDELLRMMAVLKANGLDVIQDIVLNHVTGAGSSNGAGGQDPAAMDDGSTNKFKNFRYACFETPMVNQSADTYLALKGRFPKNWQNFYPNPGNPCCTNDINSPFWGPDISYEDNAFGQSSNATFNPTQTTAYMRKGMREWLIWNKKQMGWDGVRIDAVKHFPNYVTEDFLWNLQNNAGWASGGDDMFAVGEWVDFNPAVLDWWCSEVQNRAGTFDFALRDGLYGVIAGNGLYNLGNIPNTQQNNRLRTVPFVNNHDTFRPNLDANGNYTSSWGNALAPRIEPNDGRLSVVYAIMMAVDGAPQVFFEDLFDIGYNGNRFTHDPKNPAELPVRSDVANIIWCHQNLHFKEGAYLVRWQAPDALVIERSAKALVAVTDHWTQWQELIGVQTNFPDGTVLQDYSGAVSGTRTVYGGGLVDISIPPCNGSAPLGRRGYSIWAPVGIETNYAQPIKRITQEWEMANDLGDSHFGSLQQGGALPNQTTNCRTVGKIYAQANKSVNFEVFTEHSALGVRLFLEDANCMGLDSTTQTGNFSWTYTPTTAGWITIKLRNASATQNGQRAWVKVNYESPQVVQTNVPKLKCACELSSTGINDTSLEDCTIYPNPTGNYLYIELTNDNHGFETFEIISLDGRVVQSGIFHQTEINQLVVNHLKAGVYLLRLIDANRSNQLVKRFIKD